jgi:hypothetical protein
LKESIPTDVEILSALKDALKRYPSQHLRESTRASHGRCIQEGLSHRGDAFAVDDWILLRAISAGVEDIAFPVSSLPVTLGRRGCAVSHRVGCTGVSRMHCRFERDTPFVRLVDTKSKNGTLLNGQRISAEYIADGDTIQVGDALFSVNRA